MKAHIRGKSAFDRKTQEAIVEVAKKEFEAQENQFIICALEIVFRAMHLELGVGPARMRRVWERMWQDFDEQCARYNLNEDTSRWGAQRRRHEATYTYAQWVHDRLVDYGVDIAAWEKEKDRQLGEAEPRRKGEK